MVFVQPYAGQPVNASTNNPPVSLLRSLQSLLRGHAPQIRQIPHFQSVALGREVKIDVYLPPSYRDRRDRKFPLLIFNDGQDLPRADYARTLERLWRRGDVPYFISVGLHANAERAREYGTARQPDYKGRGDKAGRHRDFVVGELLPMLRERFRITRKPHKTAFAGFSLGGLSALDVAWSLPENFGTAGVFSGALWWRWAPVDPRDPDGQRIMHDIVASWPGPADNGQRFWFQTGTLDEEEDRNNNGVIDAIDDTLDLIRLLRKKGYPESDIRYFEMEGGTHDPQTWGEAMPDFLRFWAAGF